LALSELLQKARRLEDAKGMLDQLLTQRPDSVEGHTSLGLLFEQMGRKSDATAQYEKVLTSTPHAARASFRLAAIYADEGKKIDDALSLALDAKRELSAESALSDLIGWLYILKDQPRLALPHLQEATQRTPENPTYHFHLGIAYGRNDQSSRARDEFRRALQIDPDFAQAAEARKALATLF
jgi:tetratricopeptide (TPR) repeat protein